MVLPILAATTSAQGQNLDLQDFQAHSPESSFR
jgi:hypothetical protein